MELWVSIDIQYAIMKSNFCKKSDELQYENSNLNTFLYGSSDIIVIVATQNWFIAGPEKGSFPDQESFSRSRKSQGILLLVREI